MKEESQSLESIATFINGYPFKPSDWKDSGRKIIRIQNLNNPDAPYNRFDEDIEPKYIVCRGDILISWSGTLGVYEWDDEDALLNQHIFKVVFNKAKVNKQYFKYAVASRISEMKEKVHGITMQHITKGEFGKTTIPLPPLSEQERIVSELDLLTEIIDKQKAQLKELDTLAQSIFYDMFGDPVLNDKGWEKKKLGEVGKIVTGSTPSTKNAENYSSNDYCFIKPSDIARDEVSNLSISEYYISEAGYNKSRKLPKGSVLVTCIGIVGKVGTLKVDATCNQQINAIIPSSAVNSIYLANAIFGIRQLLEAMANAPVVPIINKGEFAKVAIPLPSLSLQQSFADKVSAIEQQKAAIGRSIAETQQLFDYTMDKYFG